MNKKAAIILISASLAFFIASVIILNTQRTPVVLGNSPLELADLPKEAKVYTSYIEIAAKFALAETMKKTPPTSQKDFYELCKEKDRECDKLPQHFKDVFKKHIISFNEAYSQSINIDNYKFESKLITLNNKPATELTGKIAEESKNRINIKKGDNIVYMVYPHFVVRYSLDELNELATTSETIAISFLNNLADKFQKCWKESYGDKKNCFCDNSEIDPNELPEGYKVSIITTTDRANLFGGVEYQFKLLDNKNNVVVRGRNVQQIRKIKGLFGAYDYFVKDGNNLSFPGSFSKEADYVLNKNSEKGKLYTYSGAANCKGIKDFLMVEYVKESELTDFKDRPDCSKIGVAG